MMDNFKDVKQQKKPLYITVYDELFKMIVDGVFPANSQLPSEPDLAKKMGVSRMTLRQALALLQDDGLVKNIHGKGNFITKTEAAPKKDGLETLSNPLHKSHSESIDNIRLNFRIELVSEYTKQVLKREMTAVVAFERWYESKGQVVAYAFSFMAIETIAELKVDLQQTDEVIKMLEHGVYDAANFATINIKHSKVDNAPSKQYELFQGEACDLLEESVAIAKTHPIIYNKFYIPKSFSEISLTVTK